jgi:hypothetical protein
MGYLPRRRFVDFYSIFGRNRYDRFDLNNQRSVGCLRPVIARYNGTILSIQMLKIVPKSRCDSGVIGRIYSEMKGTPDDEISRK